MHVLDVCTNLNIYSESLMKKTRLVSFILSLSMLLVLIPLAEAPAFAAAGETGGDEIILPLDAVPEEAIITFYENGGIGTMTPSKKYYVGQMIESLPECEFAPPEGKVFSGWLIDGITYQPKDSYHILTKTVNIVAQWRNVTDWDQLQYRISASDGITIKLDKDITATPDDVTPLDIPSDIEVAIDLNGHTINAGGNTGNVFTVCGVLAIEDSAGGGKITGGYNPDGNGGGILIYKDKNLGEDKSGGILQLRGGTISGNSAYSGGGVMVLNGRFEMYGGTITGNKAAYGGGVEVTSGGFYMHGGIITDNTATEYGGGVELDSSSKTTMYISGDVIIIGNKGAKGEENNVNLYERETIVLSGPLGTSARIGITLDYPPDVKGKTVILTKDYNENGDVTNFFCDNDMYGLGVFEGSNELAMYLPYYGITVSESSNGTVTTVPVSSNGTVTTVPVAEAPKYEKVKINVIPDEGYVLSALTVSDGENDIPVSDFVFTMPGHSVEITPSFAKAFVSESLVLSEEIGVRFRISKPYGYDLSGSYITFELSDGRTQTASASQAADDGGTYLFTCHINALEIADTITATYHYGDGMTVSAEYRAIDYCNYVLGNQSEFDIKVVSLVRSLLNYGHYLGLTTWTDNPRSQHAAVPAGYELHEDDLSLISGEVSSRGIVKNVGDSGIDPDTTMFSLTLNSDTKINLFICKENGVPVTSAKVDGNGLKIGETTIGGKPYYTLTTGGIKASKLDDDIVIKVTTSSGEAEFTVSAMSYVKAILGSSTPEKKYAVAAFREYAMAAKSLAAN